MPKVVTAVKERLGYGERPVPVRPWLSDAPPDLATVKDAFGVDDLVNGLVELLAAAQPPFTVSLSGSWGIGKSTVAEAVVERLRRSGQAAVLVDAWTEDVPTLRRSLVVAVGAALQAKGDAAKEAAARTDIARALDEETRESKTKGLPPETQFSPARTVLAFLRRPVPLLGLIAALLVLIVLSLSADPDSPVARTLPPIIGVLVGFLLVNSGYFFVAVPSTVTTGPAERTELESAEFKKYVTGSKGGAARVLVVVDNLDRLPGDTAVKALSEIRALVEVKGSRCVFLIPVDRGALVGHITTVLDGEAGVATDKGRRAANDYLDKFFNLDLVLTKPEPVDIREWALEQAKLILPGDDDEDLRSAIQIVAYAAGSSPRAVKRILNGVSSRHRLLAREAPAIGLAKLALVESLLAQFPEILAPLSSEPRNFMTLREALSASDGAEAQTKAIVEFGGSVSDPRALASFLIAYRDIELSVPELRVILSLRRDRDWSGLTDAEGVRTAVEEGNVEAFAMALNASPDGEREHAVERAIYWAERSVGFPRDAMNAIAVAVSVAGDYPSLARRLHDVVVKVLLASDLPRRLASPSVAESAFGRHHWKLGELATRFVETLVSQKDRAEAGLLRAVQLARPHLDSKSLDTARTALAELPTEALATFFEPVVDIDFIAGPVAAALAGRVAQLDLAAPDQSATLLNLKRLTEYSAAGGSADPTLSTIATPLTTQLGAVAGDLSAAAIEVLMASAEIIRGGDPVAVDALAAVLEARPATDRGPHFDALFRLRPADARVRSGAAQFDRWLQTGDLSPAAVRPVVATHADALDASGSAWRDHLSTQWISQKQADFADIVFAFGGSDGLAKVVAAIATAGKDVPARALEAVEILRGDSSAIATLATALVDSIRAAAPIATIGPLGRVFAALQRDGVNVSSVADALGERAGGASSADVAALALAAQEIEAAGCAVVSRSADAIGRRALGVGLVDPDAASWIAGRTADKTLATKIIADVVRAPAVPVARAIDAADRARARLDRTSEIAAALIERATASGTGEPEARNLLDQAMSWRPQPASHRLEYEARLSEIATRWPALSGPAGELKLVGKRKPSRP